MDSDRIQDSDIEEAARIFQAHYSIVVSAARRFAPMPDMIYDIVQATFVDFAESYLRGTRYDENETAFVLHRITKNRAIKIWKQEKKHCSEERRQLFEALMSHDDRPSTEDNDQLERLQQCMERLPKNIRHWLDQHYRDQFNLEEIAEQCGQKSGTVRQAIFRARRQLKNCIESMGNHSLSDDGAKHE